MTETKALTIRDRLNAGAISNELAKVLPAHVTPERMVRVTLTALTRTPKLADCDQASFFRCLLDLGSLGLEPDGRRAHLIPFENRKRGCVECQLIIDYKGLVELAYRSGVVQSIHADVVREGDIFDYDLGDVRHHVPHFLRRDADKPHSAGPVIAAYCRAVLKDGATKTEVLSKEDVESIRNRSRAGQSGPWVTDWSEMAKKTAFRRVSKWLPLSAEYRDAVEREDEHERIAATSIAGAVRSAGLSEIAMRAQADMQALLEHQADTKPAPEVILEPAIGNQGNIDPQDFDPVDELRHAIRECKTLEAARELALSANELGIPDELDAKIQALETVAAGAKRVGGK